MMAPESLWRPGETYTVPPGGHKCSTHPSQRRGKMKAYTRYLPVLFIILFIWPSLALALATKEVAVDALWFASRGKEVMGGTSQVIVEVEPNPRQGIRVGFFEEVAGGSGPSWRAAGWMASVLSSQLLGVDLTHYKISFDVGGRIDGPSAGGLMTAALTAAFLGDQVKPEVSMTGIINPDGTIGPVGGIPQKLEGAAKRGKKLILIPYGQRFSMDQRLKKLVDVVERGKSLGVEVREVSDISQAYQLLTGKPLPQARPANDQPPEIPGAVQAKIRNRTQVLFSKYRELISKVKMAGQLPPELGQIVTQAESAYSLAQDAAAQGLFTVAYDRMFTAVLMAQAALVATDIIQTAQSGGGQALQNYFDSLKAVRGKLDAFLNRLDMETPRTLSDVAALSEAYGLTIQAWGSILLGEIREGEMEKLLKQAQEKAEKRRGSAPRGTTQTRRPQLGIQVSDSPYGVMVNQVAPGSPAERAGLLAGDIILQYNGIPVMDTATLLQLVSATQPGEFINLLVSRGGMQLFLTAMLESGPPPPPPPQTPASEQEWERIGQKLYEAAFFYKMADLLHTLAEDRLLIGLGFSGTPAPAVEVIDKAARLFQTTAEAGMNYLDSIVLQNQAEEAGLTLSAYRWAFMSKDPSYALAYATYLALGAGISASPYARLGASMALYYGTASLITKYYSLGAEIGKGGRVQKVRFEKALINMLERAFRNARDGINLAREAGIEPIFSAFFYEAAKFLREQDLEGKLSALAYLWYATAEARMLAFLGGGLRLERPLPVQQPAPQPGQPSSPPPGGSEAPKSQKSL
ncbi:MAG: PDZ domain-containing protein [Nitrospinota bacterium]|nr:MAG: PDZ domain-containing protein [Nitrospinota bacterium]